MNKERKNACHPANCRSLNLLSERDDGCDDCQSPLYNSIQVDGQESNFPKGSDSFSSLSPCHPSSLLHKGS